MTLRLQTESTLLAVETTGLCPSETERQLYHHPRHKKVQLNIEFKIFPLQEVKKGPVYISSVCLKLMSFQILQVSANKRVLTGHRNS